MTWKLVDDGQTPKEVYNLKIYLSALVAAVGGGLFGYDNAFFGSVLALPSFRSRFGLVGISTPALNTLSSNIAVTFQIGCLAAAITAYPVSEILGRRKAMFVYSVIFLVGAAIMLVGTLPTIYAGRLLTGMGVGPLTSIVPLYLSEISPPALRGRFIGLFEIFYQIFALLGFWVGYGCATTLPGTADAQWRIPVGLQLPLCALLAIGVIFIHESPRYLCKAGQIDKALHVISKLRSLPAEHPYCQKEITLIMSELHAERDLAKLPGNAGRLAEFKFQLREVIRPGIRYRVSLGFVTQIMGQFSGINGINYYSPRIFQSLGVRGTNTSLFATGIYGVVKTVTAIISLLILMDRIGRRASLLGGGVIMIISHFIIGTYIKIAKPVPSTTGSISSGGIAALAFVYIYVVGFVGSYASVPFILSAEAAPLNVRALSTALGAVGQWLGNLIITKATPYMISSLGYGIFYFFGSCVIVSSVYVWFFVPETRGLPMEELDRIFGMDLAHQTRRDDVETASANAEDVASKQEINLAQNVGSARA